MFHRASLEHGVKKVSGIRRGSRTHRSRIWSLARQPGNVGVWVKAQEDSWLSPWTLGLFRVYHHDSIMSTPFGKEIKNFFLTEL